MKYRIKIIESKGIVRYLPQIKWGLFFWKSISTKIVGHPSIGYSSINQWLYTIEAAENLIQKHKKEMELKKFGAVITYKYL